MANLFRRSKTLTFDDGQATVYELSAASLLKAEMDGEEMDTAFLVRECVDVDVSEITGEAYKAIVEAIVELNAPLFEGGDEKSGGVKKK